MARVKRGVTAHKRHKRVFKATKGMQGQRRHSIKKAREALFKAWTYAYRDRRTPVASSWTGRSWRRWPIGIRPPSRSSAAKPRKA